MSNRKKIIVVDYDPNWAKQFQELSRVLYQHLGSERVKIEHVGSTAIPDLKAKPVIDLDIVIEDDEAFMQEMISKLRELGYQHVGDLGITGREAFKKASTKIPDTGSGREWFKHHLYLCKKQSVGLQNHLLFRDYLINHPEKIKAYGQLKQRL
ncbi:MAG: GrpB family protein, partial [Bacteroidota bacterium]